MDLSGIENNVRMARECSLLGNYDDSLVYYDGAIADIGRFIFYISLFSSYYNTTNYLINILNLIIFF